VLPDGTRAVTAFVIDPAGNDGIDSRVLTVGSIAIDERSVPHGRTTGARTLSV
jgi:hypothetical protein